MAKTASTGTGRKVTGQVAVKDKDGNLLVAFRSVDAEDFWGQLYEAERIKYAMRNRRKIIPEYLRTGSRPQNLRRAALLLLLQNLIRR